MKTTGKRTIPEIKEMQDNKMSQLFDRLGIFFAFGNEQLNAKRKEGIAYATTDYGMFIPKDNVKDFEKGFLEIKKEIRELYGKHIPMDDYIAYELHSHEAFYTGSLQSSFEAAVLSYPDCTIDDVKRVYKAHLNERG